MKTYQKVSDLLQLWVADGKCNLEFSTRFVSTDDTDFLEELIRYALARNLKLKLIVEPDLDVANKVHSIVKGLEKEASYNLSLLTLSIS